MNLLERVKYENNNKKNKNINLLSKLIFNIFHYE